MNEGKPLHDPKVRAALIQCLDRETYNKVLLKDTFIPGKAPVPPSLDYGFDQLKDPNAYNPEMLRSCWLKQVGKIPTATAMLIKTARTWKSTSYSTAAVPSCLCMQKLPKLMLRKSVLRLT